MPLVIVKGMHLLCQIIRECLCCDADQLKAHPIRLAQLANEFAALRRELTKYRDSAAAGEANCWTFRKTTRWVASLRLQLLPQLLAHVEITTLLQKHLLAFWLQPP